MNLFNFIKNIFQKKKDKEIKKQPKTTGLSVIDTTEIEIDRNLTNEELESRNKFFEEISSGNISTFINYGNDISKQINFYIGICRKRIDQGIKFNQTLARKTSTENVIREKIKIIFNKAEVEDIIEELKILKRNCELRIIALEDCGNVELKKGQRKILFLRNISDADKINSINNAISRISAIIKIINTLIYSLEMEKNNYLNENSSLDVFINASPSNDAKQVSNDVLIETFQELRDNLNSLSSFTNVPSVEIDGTPINEVDITSPTLSLKSKVKIVGKLKKYLDLYVAQKRKDLLAPGGLLDRAQMSLHTISEDIKSDYLDLDLWAKKAFSETIVLDKDGKNPYAVNTVYHKYGERLENIERFSSIFSEEIPDDFKEKFYKTKFYFYALYMESKKNDAIKSASFQIKSEEEKQYYIKFITDIVDKMHRESKDGELLQFMDKYLSLKDINSILNEHEKLVALLRIEKYGRGGLFTLILFKRIPFNQNYYSCCLDQISMKPSTITKEPINNSEMANDILKLWSLQNYDRPEDSYNRFWGTYESSAKLESILNRPFNPYENYFTYYSSNLDYFEFLAKTIAQTNKLNRLNKKENDEELFIKSGNIKVHKGLIFALESIAFEKISKGQVKKEDVLNILQNSRKSFNNETLIQTFISLTRRYFTK